MNEYTALVTPAVINRNPNSFKLSERDEIKMDLSRLIDDYISEVENRECQNKENKRYRELNYCGALLVYVDMENKSINICRAHYNYNDKL